MSNRLRARNEGRKREKRADKERLAELRRSSRAARKPQPADGLSYLLEPATRSRL